MATKPQFPDFVQLSQSVFYFDAPPPVLPPPPSPPKLSASYVIIPPSEKPEAKESPLPPSPDLIILCTWMNANPKHVQKYTASYRTLYPSAKLLIITSNTKDVILPSEKTQQTNLAPVFDVISTFTTASSSSSTRKTRNTREKTTKAKILLHAFSNGGASNARLLASYYQQQNKSPLPLLGMVIDSAPGVDDYQASVRAFSVNASPKSLASYPVYLLALIAAHLIMVGFWVRHMILILVRITTVKPPPLTWNAQLRVDLNTTAYFSTTIPRAYIFSDGDVMIGAPAVASHAEEAKEAGYVDTRTEFFKGSSHVNHVSVDKERYWAIVQSVVNDGVARLNK